ncbi:MAG TPA: BON domain-containing protein [Vicinamibacterales bacterium]|nr:BON domain-containing protein [Vicinamibacterales bacterium]
MVDRDLQKQVQNALEWEPSIDAAHVGVAVDKGVVTLTGEVRTFAEKAAAERVALKVYGVGAVANDIAVHLPSDLKRTDADIARAALEALTWHAEVPPQVSVVVSDGVVTLIGTVEWNYQKDAAARVLRYLKGVRNVVNDITVRPHVNVADVRAKIEAALKRSAEVDARRINVAIHDSVVTLTGNVHSWAERFEARQAAWAAPGVRTVEDRITVVP